MGLACAMTALLMVPNPQKIRAALLAQRTPSLLPFERALLDEEELLLDEAEEALVAEDSHSSGQTVAENVVRGSEPQAVASIVTEISPTPASGMATAPETSVAIVKDQTFDRDLQARTEVALELPQTAADQAPDLSVPAMSPVAQSPVAQGLGTQSNPVLIASSDPNLSLQLSPPVIPTHELGSVGLNSGAAVEPLQQPTLSAAEFPVASVPAHRGVGPVPILAPADTQPISSNPFSSYVSESQDIVVPDPFQQNLRVAANPSLGAPSPSVTGSEVGMGDDVILEVLPGSQAGRFNFRFRNAPLQDALQLIGDQYNMTVVVHSDVEGTYTGELKNIDPQIAVSIILKVNRLSLGNRGNVILVRPMESEATRFQQNR